MSIAKKPQSLIPNTRLSIEHKAIYRALELNVTFIAYVKPGLNKLTFIADIPYRKIRSNETFSIGLWNEPSRNNIIIHDTCGPKEFLEDLPDEPLCEMPEMVPHSVPTPQLLHKGQVISIVTNLKENNGGKTVLSRIICGKGPEHEVEKVWLHAVMDYFKLYPNTFRYIYFTPETGAWIGASPELLLKADLKTGIASTMALAGTRSCRNSKNTWDSKNEYEHELVLDYIIERLKESGVTDISITARNLKYGFIEHCCHDIKFNLNGTKPADLLDSLSPTPAFAGVPKEEAIKRISHLELHDRKCYGGYIMHSTDDSIEAYVNLRCAHFYKNSYCIYTGSGITPDSKPDDEWRETEKKTEYLHTIISAGMSIHCHNLNSDNS